MKRVPYSECRLASDEKLGAHYDRPNGCRSRRRISVYRSSPLHVGNVGALRCTSISGITMLNIA
jgi:hypothetical protein